MDEAPKPTKDPLPGAWEEGETIVVRPGPVDVGARVAFFGREYIITELQGGCISGLREIHPPNPATP